MNDKVELIANRADLEYVMLKAWYMVEDGSVDFAQWLKDTANGDYGPFWKSEAKQLVAIYNNS